MKGQREAQSQTLTDICPMSFANPKGPFECCKEQCHWWSTYYAGKDNEWAECAMKALGTLYDLT